MNGQVCGQPLFWRVLDPHTKEIREVCWLCGERLLQSSAKDRYGLGRVVLVAL